MWRTGTANTPEGYTGEEDPMGEMVYARALEGRGQRCGEERARALGTDRANCGKGGITLTNIGPVGPESTRFRSHVLEVEQARIEARNRPKLGPNSTLFARNGQHWPGIGQRWSEISGGWPGAAEFDHNWLGIDQTWFDSHQTCPASGQAWPELDQLWPPSFGRRNDTFDYKGSFRPAVSHTIEECRRDIGVQRGGGYLPHCPTTLALKEACVFNV